MQQAHQTTSSDQSPLQQAAEAFAQWRKSRQGRKRIPEELGSLACHAAQACGVSKTAHTLKTAKNSTGIARSPVDTDRGIGIGFQVASVVGIGSIRPIGPIGPIGHRT